VPGKTGFVVMLIRNLAFRRDTFFFPIIIIQYPEAGSKADKAETAILVIQETITGLRIYVE